MPEIFQCPTLAQSLKNQIVPASVGDLLCFGSMSSTCMTTFEDYCRDTAGIYVGLEREPVCEGVTE